MKIHCGGAIYWEARDIANITSRFIRLNLDYENKGLKMLPRVAIQ